MEVKSKVVQIAKTYIANDGKEFSKKRDCEIYEKYYPQTIYDIIKDYCVIEKESDIEKYKNNKVPVFTYLLVTKAIPDDKIDYCEIIEKDSKSYIPNIDYSDKPTLFFNNWTNAFNGGYGFNGWERVGDKDRLEKKIENYKNLLEKYEKMLDKVNKI